jgi:hypothetical protein
MKLCCVGCRWRECDGTVARDFGAVREHLLAFYAGRASLLRARRRLRGKRRARRLDKISVQPWQQRHQ